MNIDFNENGDFYFLRKDDVRRDLYGDEIVVKN